MAETTILWADSETGGLDDRVYDAISLGWVLTDLAGNPREEGLVRVHPVTPPNPGAAKVNGYDPRTWRADPKPRDKLLTFSRLAAASYLGGHNPGFDKPFVRDLLERWRVPFVLGDHHLLDTASLAFPLYRAGKVADLKLKTLCAYFQVPNAGAHDALQDARRTAAVYRGLVAAGVT